MFDDSLSQWNQMNLPDDVLNRLWKKVDVILNSDNTQNTKSCWLFTGSVDRDGYPKFSINCKCRTATRIMYECYNGPIGKGLCICHTCDNPTCINPNHLFAATHAQNMEDRKQKGREAKGSQVGSSKLTKEDIKSILQGIYDDKFTTNIQISQFYNMDPSTILHILKGHIWKHVSYDFCKQLGCTLNSLKIKVVVGIVMSDLKVVKIRVRLKLGETPNSLANEFKINRHTVSDIKIRKTWDNIPNEKLLTEQYIASLNITDPLIITSLLP